MMTAAIKQGQVRVTSDPIDRLKGSGLPLFKNLTLPTLFTLETKANRVTFNLGTPDPAISKQGQEGQVQSFLSHVRAHTPECITDYPTLPTLQGSRR
jgi:hypothetical protein